MDQSDLDPFDAQTAEERAAEEQAARLRQRHALSEMVAGRIRRAVDARRMSGIEEIWRDDDDQYNGIDIEDSPANAPPSGKSQRQGPVKTSSNRSRIYVNITKPKTDAGVARVQELLVPHDDKPWEIGPTPVPELAAAAEGRDPRTLTLADGTQRSAQDVAKVMLVEAEEHAKKMADQIEDWFVEGSVYAQWRRVIHDAGRIGTGVLKGPFPAHRKDRKYLSDGTLQETLRLAPTSRAISAWDLFPDPSCGENLHDGAYCAERDYLTGRSVRELARLPDYDASEIAKILLEGPRSNGRYDDRSEREKDGQVHAADADTFDTFYYYGDIPPETLIAGGWRVEGLLDADDAEALAGQAELALQLVTVPVVCTVINERIVRVSLNPLETGEFPFDVFVWEIVEGQLWGRGIPHQMRPAQRMLNGATRAMLENAGLSAGPQIVIDRDRIEPANGRYEITGRKLWYWRPGEEVKDVRFAFQAVTIPSAQPDLQNIIRFALEMADHLTNLPLLIQGDMGAAPDTVGGMAMLEANAVSPLRVKAKHYDDRLVIPHIRRYYRWGMQDPNVPDDAKGDMQVKARGASALVQRDLYAQVLPQLMPFVKDPDFELDPKRYMTELLRANKLNPSALSLTAEQVEERRKQQAENPPQDPRIQAAQINAQAKAEDRQADMADRQQSREHEAAESAAQREHEALIADVEFQIQALEFAGQKEISFEQLRAMLATKAMDIRNKREMFVAERDFAVTEGEGRGL